MGARFGVWAILLLNVLSPTHHLHAATRGDAGHSGDWPTTLVICTADGQVEIAWPAPAEVPTATNACPICSLAQSAAAAALPTAPVLLLPWPMALSPAVYAHAPAAGRRLVAFGRPRAPPIRA